ncbi:hypothetical protein FF1_014502 [Malus domestica]
MMTKRVTKCAPESRRGAKNTSSVVRRGILIVVGPDTTTKDTSVAKETTTTRIRTLVRTSRSRIYQVAELEPGKPLVELEQEKGEAGPVVQAMNNKHHLS